MAKVKKDIVALIQLAINYMFLVMFHNVSNNSILVHIDPLLDDTDSFPTNTSTLVPNHHTSSSPSRATLTPSETMDHFSPHSSQHLSKFTQLPILFIPLIQILLHHF